MFELKKDRIDKMVAVDRYQSMGYQRCGRSGLDFPVVSLGLWHNWGDEDSYENASRMILRAFDLGITHFDLSNNYGPPVGAAEKHFGRILRKNLSGYRDELLISTKAGYDMWPGPYGNWGSKKYLIASLDQSLKRLGLDYVDVFYHHRPDPKTPLEETMGALDQIVRSGKALYIGLSRYTPDQTQEACKILRTLGTPCLIHQVRYNLFEREIEVGLLEILKEEGIGCIAFSPLAQGLLTDKYLKEIPTDSRAAKSSKFLTPESITSDKLSIINQLSKIASDRGQSLAQMSISWVLRKPQVTSALVGASSPGQISELVAACQKKQFSEEEICQIDAVLI